MHTSLDRHLRRIATGAFLAGMFLTAPLAAQAQGAGFFTLTGEDAAGYATPSDMTLTKSLDMPRLGVTYERYQQNVEGAEVLGGQVTIHRDESGDVIRVIGAYYPDLLPTNSVRITPQRAGGLVDRDIGPDGERDVKLMIDPKDGKLFYRVETRRADSRWVHWIGAGDGATLNKFDALTNQAACPNAPGETGVAGTGFGRAYYRNGDDSGDLKTLDCLITSTGVGTETKLETSDLRQSTHDQGSSRKPFIYLNAATNPNESWDTPGRVSPATGPLVDAHYYVRHADQYYLSLYGFDFLASYPFPITIHGHYTKDYVNAFWNGSYFGFGDGDGVNYDTLTSMDVAAHEFTHSVTESFSDLIYQGESGALNESFSDIMAAVIERLSDECVLDPEPENRDCAGGTPLTMPDSEWLVGEDFDLVGDGFRDMSDPAADGDKANYADLYTGTADNGGVHTNSGISNHAFYLLVTTPNPDIDIQDAADVFFLGFTSLTTNATFCDAREATISTADLSDRSTTIPKRSNGPDLTDAVTTAWAAVGLDNDVCGGGTANILPNADFTPPTCNAGQSCSFDATGSSDSDGTIVNYAWNFGDGGTDSTTSTTTSHTFAASSTDASYSVELTVTDNDGGIGKVTKLVQVKGSGGGSVTLTIDNAYKTKGTRYVTLSWAGVTSTDVDIRVNGAFAIMVSALATPYYLDAGKGGSMTVQVCEAGSNVCSADVLVTF